MGELILIADWLICLGIIVYLLAEKCAAWEHRRWQRTLPQPKTWKEFDDIILEIARKQLRRWADLTATKSGRVG